MNKITSVLLKVNHIEAMADYDSPIHRFHPLFKLLASFFLLISILTCNASQILQLMIYGLIIAILASIAKIPLKAIISRSLLGLPLSLCLGLSNLFLMRGRVYFYGLVVTTGTLSLISILLKTGLCLSIVFLLIATTRFDSIASSLVQIKVPSLFVLQLLMTYRYIFLLVEEASTMSKAYLLKNPSKNAIEMKDMGSFIGSLLMRSFKRSDEVYQAMKCRGFNVSTTYNQCVDFTMDNYFLLSMVIGLLIVIKVVI